MEQASDEREYSSAPEEMDMLAHRLEIYKLAFQHTEGEVGSLWRRNDAFLIANSILAILVAENFSEPILASAVAAFCLIVSILWARANWQSAMWERFWIRECKLLEKGIPECELWTRAGKMAGKRKGGPSTKWDKHELYLSIVFVGGWLCVLWYLLVKVL